MPKRYFRIVLFSLFQLIFVFALFGQSESPEFMHDIFKIKGLKIGQAQDTTALTGVTVLLFEEGAVASVDVRGSAPGTRETALLEPGNLVEQVHAIVLSGGSAYGLDAMGGVAAYLEGKGIGFDTGPAVVPIVTGAVLYDLNIGNATVRPDFKMGFEAAQAAGRDNFLEGNYGAGTGATVGKVRGPEYAAKGGIGCAVLEFNSGLIVAAIVAVNALGDIYEGETKIAGLLNEEKNAWASTEAFILNGYQDKVFKSGNTTLGVVVTNAKLTKAQAKKLAASAHDAFARCIRPVHTLYDGDSIFAAGTGEVEFSDQLFLSVAANRVMEQAIIRAVKKAESAGNHPSGKEILQRMKNK